MVSAAYKQKRTIPKVIFPGPGIQHLTEIAEDVERDVRCLCPQYKDYTEATEKKQHPTPNTNKQQQDWGRGNRD